MNSFISRSKNCLPPVLCAILATILLGLLLSATYTLYLDPEIQFYKQAYRIKDTHARELDAQTSPKFIFAGGSSCAFQINTGLISKNEGISCVNMGMHAGMGGQVLVAVAMAEIKPGDTLIVSLEPSVVIDPRPTQLGYQTVTALGDKRIDDSLAVLGTEANFFRTCNMLRPGLRNLSTLAARIVYRQPLFRYQPGDVSPDGYMTTSLRNPQPGQPLTTLALTPASKVLLTRLMNWAKEKNVRVAYLLPLQFYLPENAPQAKLNNIAYLKQIAAYMPILQDEGLGISTSRNDFADTGFHLTTEAATRRSEKIGPICANWQLGSVDAIGHGDIPGL